VLTYLPSPYHDELLYSIVARYISHIGKVRGASVEQLFGKRTLRARIDLPSSLGRFADNAALVWGMTAEEIAEKYTLLPFYTHFANDVVKTKAMGAMKSDSGTGLHAKLGINTSRVKVPSFLRYCPECASEDFNRWGETYWRRTHQLPGVLMCTKHEALLMNSSVPYRPIALWDFIDASEAVRGTSTSASTLSPVVFLASARSVAQRCEDFLQRKETQWGHSDVPVRYRDAVSNGGFHGGDPHGYGKKIDQAMLENSFVDFFGREFLAAINCDIRLGSDTNWLRETFRSRGRNRHPVQHALIQLFLETLPENNSHSHPFGRGPWKCPNPYCDQEMAESIRSIRVSSDVEGRPIASASCPCGFQFTFRATNEGIPVVGKLVLYGRTWAKKAKDLVGSGISKRAASKILGVCQGTIDDLLEGKTKRGKNEVAQKEILAWRKEWQLLQEQSPDRSRDKARVLNPKLYSRLRRHDSEWFYAEPRQFARPQGNLCRVDWESRDRSVVERLKSAAKEIKESVPLKRASPEGIIRHARLSRLAWGKKDRLPLSMIELEELAESVDDFRERHLRHAAVEMAEEGLPWKPWVLRRRTGLEGFELSKRLTRVIEEIMGSHDNFFSKASERVFNFEPAKASGLIEKDKGEYMAGKIMVDTEKRGV
jgi:hypothetical protein